MGSKNESGEDWRPQPIFIASQKSTKNADIFKLVGNGGMYFHGPGTAVPKTMHFFPLYITWNKKLFMDGRPVCISEDGKTGRTLSDIYPLRGVPPQQNYTAAIGEEHPHLWRCDLPEQAVHEEGEGRPGRLHEKPGAIPGDGAGVLRTVEKDLHDRRPVH